MEKAKTKPSGWWRLLGLFVGVLLAVSYTQITGCSGGG